jgi:stage V sporulation protein B
VVTPAGAASAEAQSPSEEQQAKADEKARTAGRGGLAVLGAKVFFILVGFVQQALLARAIGEAGYGALSRVLAKANVLNNVVVSGSTQGVSRAVARAAGHEDEAFRATLRVHVPLAIVLAVGFVGAAPMLASFEKAEHIALPLMVLGGVVLLYGLYAPLIGSLNGRARFTKQAALDVTFAVLRTAGMVGLGWLLFSRGMNGTLGATLGFVAAAACIVPIALRWTGIGKKPAKDAPWAPKPGAYLLELLPMSFAQLCTNLLMQLDITLLGRFSSEAALASGLTAQDADRWVAYYRACQLFAFLPYQLLMSITLVLFPMLARAKAEGDRDGVRRYVAQGARLGAIATGLMVSVVAALPSQVLGFAYPAEYAAHGATALRLLALGQGAFAMLGIAVTVLTSLGHEWRSALVTLGAVIAVVVANWLLLSGTTLGEDQLVRTAMATGGGLVAALVVAGIAVKAHTGAFVPLFTAIRVIAAVALCTVGGSYLPHFGKLMTPVLAIVVVAAYLALMIGTREIGGADVANVKAMLRKRGAK